MKSLTNAALRSDIRTLESTIAQALPGPQCDMLNRWLDEHLTELASRGEDC